MNTYNISYNGGKLLFEVEAENEDAAFEKAVDIFQDALSIEEVETDPETPVETNAWLRAGGF